MGSGRWDPGTYTRTTSASLASHGTPFVHNSVTKAAGKAEVAESLDPKAVAGDLSPFAGQIMRESRDSDEHPESLPIAVVFDVTGSMGQIPVVLQGKLPKLYGLLLAKGYVEHPQILFGAVGDAYSDRVPLQIGQFESDNRADANLADIFLEGGGGGGNHESYQLAAYFVARHTATDAWDKRGKKGYLFLIGDERTYRSIDPRQVSDLIGDDLPQPLSAAEIFEELKERWEVFFLFAEQGSYATGQVVAMGAESGDAHAWHELLGQNAIVLDDADAVCEVIALTVGLGEGAIDLTAGLDDLRAEGTDERSLEAAGKALATVGAGASPALGEASDDLDVGEDEGAERL